jgi:hypothetical protein
MKKFTIILTVLIAMLIKTNAQIPNYGFENWTTVGSYQNPTGWATVNSLSTGSFHSCTRSTDHTPVNVGNYSLRIQSDTAFLTNFSGLGIVMSGTQLLSGPRPSFAISGHPISLTGYYKFIPQKNDTMFIQVQLYHSGIMVMSKKFTSTVAATAWTPFNLLFYSYMNADSGNILLAAYNADNTPPQFLPHGNSVLYVDNLNFDNFINSVDEKSAKDILIDMYPNPVTDHLDIETFQDALISIFGIQGQLFIQRDIKPGKTDLDFSDFAKGQYVVKLITTEGSVVKKFIKE